MAVQRIAVETWQMILRYAIAVPVFFDTNPIQEHGLEEYSKSYDDDSLYWRSERHRNLLRRVCSSWNLYLQRYNSRYVILDDVKDGKLRINAITQAIRLEHHSGWRDIPVYRTLIKQALFLEPETWPLEILHMGPDEIRNPILRSKKIVHLSALVYAEEVDLLLLSPHRIKHSDINGFEDNNMAGRRVSLVHMTSLCLTVDSITPFLAYDFPTLRHLSICLETADGTGLTTSRYLDVMRHVGKQLITFFDKSRPSRKFLPQETWSLCPKLEQFQTRFRWPVKPRVPGSLRTVRLAADVVDTGGENMVNHDIVPLVSNIHFLGFDFSWKEALLEHERSILYVQYALDHGMTVYDKTGMLFQELVVKLLLHLKNRDTSFMQSLHRHYLDF